MKDVKIETIEMDMSEIAEYKSNPRTISKKDFAVLKKSLKDFPSMLDIREIVVDELNDMITKLKPEKGLEPILRARAAFFAEFDFQKIADYYAKADKNTQELMKRLGLVIVIPKEAYEKGMCDFRESFDEE